MNAICAHNFSEEQEKTCIEILQKNIDKLKMTNNTTRKIEGKIALLKNYISLLRDLRAYREAPSKEQADRLRRF